MSEYQGADWIKRNFKCEMSEFGMLVANLLGDLYLGIYHMNPKSLRKVEWNNPDWMQVTIFGSFHTYDDDMLTLIVILAHERCVRIGIEAAGPKYLRLVFYRRERCQDKYRRHPALFEVVAKAAEITSRRQVDQ